MAKKSSFFDVVKGLTQKKGTKDKEIEKYEKILEEHPDDRNALNVLGDLYAKRGNTEKACEYYLKVGELYARDGFTLKAIAVYKKAQRAKPEVFQTYIDLADLYVQKGLVGEAKTNYLAAAEMQAAVGKKHESLDIYRKIADLDPTNINIRTKLAAMYEGENFIEDAAAIYVDIGDAIIQKNFEDGNKYYLRALELQADNEDILSRIGYSYTEVKKKQEAADIFRKLTDMFPRNIDYKEQFEELTTISSLQEEAVVETGSIEFSEEELTSLNFGDDVSGGSPATEENILDFQSEDGGLTEVPQAESSELETDEHLLDFHIEEQGAISWDDGSTDQDVSTSQVDSEDHSLDFNLGGESPGGHEQQPSDSGSADFFDLAGRLDTSKEHGAAVERGQWAQSPSTQQENLRIEAPEKLALSEIDEIVKEFKQGVLEEVGTEDYETHYELGISYKEMSLLDDAIEELKLASLEPSKFVECQGIIALCYLEKGEPEQAIQAFNEARVRVEERGDKYQDLTYQIATIYENDGKVGEAAQVFQELFQINPNYRDVKRRLNKLLG